jgi:hypothetical protein
MIVLGAVLPGFAQQVHELFWSQPQHQDGSAITIADAAESLYRDNDDKLVIALLQDIYFSCRPDAFDEDFYKKHFLDESTDWAGILDGYIFTVVRQILRDGWLDPVDDQGRTAREEDRRLALEHAAKERP